MANDERKPLLGKKLKNVDVQILPTEIKLKKHIGLATCIGVIIGNVIGSGIFVSPKGVTESVGSVGATLIIWAVVGLYCLLQALCYSELATVIPKAGGDYAYVYYILGPLLGFLCMWIHIVLACSSSNAVIAQTAAIYLLKVFGHDCQGSAVMLIACLIIVTFAVLNGLSTKWSGRIQDVLSLAKVIALSGVIILGMVQLGRGYTRNFENAFEGTTTNPAMFSVALLDAYFAFKGWELVMTLPEEMHNPHRDLPLGIVISMIGITTIYVLANAAYFSMLTTSELLASDAVALTFAQRTFPSFYWVISIFVSLSCMGTINGSFLGDTRYLFAGGRFNQVPKVYAMLSLKFFTPLLSIITVCIISIIYCQIPSVELLVEYAALGVQLKILTALIALLYLRYKRPHVHRPIKMPLGLIIGVIVFLVVLVGFTFYSSPKTAAVGVGLFILGIPVFFISEALSKTKASQFAIDKITIFLQQLLLIVPESRRKRNYTLNIDDMFPNSR